MDEKLLKLTEQIDGRVTKFLTTLQLEYNDHLIRPYQLVTGGKPLLSTDKLTSD